MTKNDLLKARWVIMSNVQTDSNLNWLHFWSIFIWIGANDQKNDLLEARWVILSGYLWCEIYFKMFVGIWSILVYIKCVWILLTHVYWVMVAGGYICGCGRPSNLVGLKLHPYDIPSCKLMAIVVTMIATELTLDEQIQCHGLRDWDHSMA